MDTISVSKKRNIWCYCATVISLVGTGLFFAEDFGPYYLLRWLFTVLIFPLILYSSYLVSKINKLIAFVAAAIIDFGCFLVLSFLYHYQTSFRYWHHTETMGLFVGMFLVKLFLFVVFLLVFISVYKSERHSNALDAECNAT